jgi:hypothetical protein
MSQEIKKSFFRRHPVWSVIGGILLFFILIGIFAPKSTSTKNITKEDTRTEQSVPKVPELTVKASTFISEYNSNEIGADKKYKDKFIEISGQVHSVGVMFDKPFVLIQGGQNDVFMVQCMVSDKNKDTVADLTKGQNVTMTGTVDGKSLHIAVNDCQLVK